MKKIKVMAFVWADAPDVGELQFNPIEFEVKEWQNALDELYKNKRFQGLKIILDNMKAVITRVSFSYKKN